MRKLFLTALLTVPVLAQSPPDIEVLHVRGNVYMFASDSGNVTVQVGEHRDNDGVLMVDTGSAQMADRILAKLKNLTNKQLKYVVNTSADLDHDIASVIQIEFEHLLGLLRWDQSSPNRKIRLFPMYGVVACIRSRSDTWRSRREKRRA